jgi:hypothetical protein
VLSTVAVARTENVLGGDRAADTALAMTEGFQTAFLVAFGIAVLGALLALVLFQGGGKTEAAVIEAARRAAPCPPTRAGGLPALEVERGIPG